MWVWQHIVCLFLCGRIGPRDKSSIFVGKKIGKKPYYGKMNLGHHPSTPFWAFLSRCSRSIWQVQQWTTSTPNKYLTPVWGLNSGAIQKTKLVSLDSNFDKILILAWFLPIICHIQNSGIPDIIWAKNWHNWAKKTHF